MRPIDADALISDLEYDVELDSRLLDDTGLVGFHRELTQFDKDCKANTIAFLKEAPTVDAVLVVRCKDCKHWTRNDGMFKDFDEREWHHCPHLGIDTDGYFSCIEGERKEE